MPNETPLGRIRYGDKGSSPWYDPDDTDGLVDWLAAIEQLGIVTYPTFSDLPDAGTTPSDGDEKTFAAVVADRTVYRDDGTAWNPWMGHGTEENPLGDVYRESLHTEQTHNADNPVTARIIEDDGDYVASGRYNEIVRGGDIGEVLTHTFGDQPEGGEVTISNGRYYLASPAILNHQDVLCGEGGYRGAEIELEDGADTDALIYRADRDRAHNAEIKQVYLRGNKEANASGSGIVVDNTNGDPDDFHIDRVFAHMFADHGMNIDSNWGTRITRCLFETNDQYGLRFTAGQQTLIANSFLAYNGSHGCYARVRLSTVQGCWFRENGGDGLNIGMRDNTVTNCRAYQNDGAGFFDNGDRNEFVGCVAVDRQDTPTQTYGFDFGGTGTVAVGLVAYGSANADIRVTGSDVTIIGAYYESIDDSGTRTLVNGRGTNSGNPSSGGEWNGHADRAAKWDATIYDVTSTAPHTAYVVNESGDWEIDERSAA